MPISIVSSRFRIVSAGCRNSTESIPAALTVHGPPLLASVLLLIAKALAALASVLQLSLTFARIGFGHSRYSGTYVCSKDSCQMWQFSPEPTLVFSSLKQTIFDKIS